MHIIDLDAEPFIPELFSVEVHRPGGKFEWDPMKVAIHLEEVQKNGRCLAGNELRKLLESKPVPNANLLDFLLDHQELIPKDWEGMVISFWGTIYRDQGDMLTVRCMCRSGNNGRWFSGMNWLYHDFGSRDKILVLSSKQH